MFTCSKFTSTVTKNLVSQWFKLFKNLLLGINVFFLHFNQAGSGRTLVNAAIRPQSQALVKVFRVLHFYAQFYLVEKQIISYLPQLCKNILALGRFWCISGKRCTCRHDQKSRYFFVISIFNRGLSIHFLSIHT